VEEEYEKGETISSSAQKDVPVGEETKGAAVASTEATVELLHPAQNGGKCGRMSWIERKKRG